MDGVTFGSDGLALGSHGFLAHLLDDVVNKKQEIEGCSAFKQEGAALTRRRLHIAGTNAGCSWQLPVRKEASSLYASPLLASAYMDTSRMGILSIARNVSTEAHRAYLHQPTELIDVIRNTLFE